MKKIIFLFFILNSLTIFSQTNFDRGFSEGYKKGFCQDKGIGCMEPIPPIAPIPQIGEDMNSYSDGYNRGFKMGLQQNSSDDGRKRYQTSKAQFVDDFIYNPYKDMNIVDLKMKAISAIMDRAVTNYNNGNYDDVISNANDLIGIQNDFAIAYYLKSIAYFKKGEILNSYNNGVKQYQLYNSAERKKWFDQIYEFTEDYLKQELANENYNKVKYFCENVWSKNNLSNFYLGVSNYFLGDYKSAKKYFKKVDDFAPATQYLNAMENNQVLQNPYSYNSKNQSSENKQSSNTDKAKKIYEEINSNFESKNYQKVLEMLQPAIKAIESGKISDGKYIQFIYYYKTFSEFYLKNYTEAVKSATMLINNSDNKDIGGMYFLRATAKNEIGDYYGSNSDYDFLIENSSRINYTENSLATLLNNKAYNFVLLKDYKSAQTLINKAIGLDKEKEYIWGTKGELEYQLGQYNEAIKSTSNSINIAQNGNAFLFRGLSFIKIGKKSEGCKDLSKAGELGENSAYDEIKKYCK